MPYCLNTHAGVKVLSLKNISGSVPSTLASLLSWLVLY